MAAEIDFRAVCLSSEKVIDTVNS